MEIAGNRIWYQSNKPKRVAKQDFARALRRGAWQYQVIKISSELRFNDLNNRGDYRCAALYYKVKLRNSLQQASLIISGYHLSSRVSSSTHISQNSLLGFGLQTHWLPTDFGRNRTSDLTPAGTLKAWPRQT